MISLSTATVYVAKKIKKLIGTVVVYEMRKSAAGYNLYNDNLFPDRAPEPAIDLRLHKRKVRIPRH